MLCGHFYMPLLLVTVARGSKVPGAACSPFQSALTNHLLKWRTIMTTINLKRYYPYVTDNVVLEVSDEIAAALSMGGACAIATSGRSAEMASARWTPIPALRSTCSASP